MRLRGGYLIGNPIRERAGLSWLRKVLTQLQFFTYSLFDGYLIKAILK